MLARETIFLSYNYTIFLSYNYSICNVDEYGRSNRPLDEYLLKKNQYLVGIVTLTL
jgi:hypothetical protein